MGACHWPDLLTDFGRRVPYRLSQNCHYCPLRGNFILMIVLRLYVVIVTLAQDDIHLTDEFQTT